VKPAATPRGRPSDTPRPRPAARETPHRQHPAASSHNLGVRPRVTLGNNNPRTPPLVFKRHGLSLATGLVLGSPPPNDLIGTASNVIDRADRRCQATVSAPANVGLLDPTLLNTAPRRVQTRHSLAGVTYLFGTPGHMVPGPLVMPALVRGRGPVGCVAPCTEACACEALGSLWPTTSWQPTCATPRVSLLVLVAPDLTPPVPDACPSLPVLWLVAPTSGAGRGDARWLGGSTALTRAPPRPRRAAYPGRGRSAHVDSWSERPACGLA
jgi:hypothetical protein